MTAGPNIVAVVVCYYPNIAVLQDTCSLLVESGTSVILINNSIEVELQKIRSLGIRVFCPERNTGIAGGQNIGIRMAIEDGADAILLLDQDSVPRGDYIKILRSIYVEDPLSVISPVHFDPRTRKKSGGARISKLGSKIIVNEKYYNNEVDLVIASGLCIPRSMIEKVGLMEEDLFIDGVDTEWCFRCRAKSGKIKTHENLVLDHQVGDKVATIGPLSVFSHSAVRVYYRTRNPLILCRRPYVPLGFRLREVLSAVIHGILVVAFSRNAKEYFKMYKTGIIDGICGRTGARNN